MELRFQKTVCKYLNPVVNQVQNQELTQEIRLPDGMPDIGRVLSGWGQVILRGKEWGSSSVSVSGGLMLWVLYMPEDGTAPRCIENWIPFQLGWDIEAGTRDGQLRIHCLTRFVDVRSVSARKIMVRAGIAAHAQALQSTQTEIPTPDAVPEHVQLLRSVYPVRLLREAGEKAFVVDEELRLPDSCPAPEKLLYYTICSTVTECKVMGSRIAFRGMGNLHVLYLSEEGQLHAWDFELPFSQLADLEDNYGADAQADICMGVTSLELHLDDEGHMHLKAGLLAQYRVDDRVLLEAVEDAYSLNCPVELQTQTLEFPVILEKRTQQLQPTQSIHQDANLIADIRYYPDFPRQRRSTDAVKLEFPGQFQALYYGKDGMLQSGTARWEGDLQLNADERSELTVMPETVPQAHGAAQAESIEMGAESALTITSTARQQIPVVTGMELGESMPPEPDRPSLILRRAGKDRLWDIARSTGSTVASIREANGLDAEPEGNRILLIPVR